jgi:hypothetical protein
VLLRYRSIWLPFPSLPRVFTCTRETNAEKAHHNWGRGLTLDFTLPSKLAERLHVDSVATRWHCECARHLLLLCFGTAIRLIAAEQARQAPLIEGRGLHRPPIIQERLRGKTRNKLLAVEYKAVALHYCVLLAVTIFWWVWTNAGVLSVVNLCVCDESRWLFVISKQASRPTKATPRGESYMGALPLAHSSTWLNTQHRMGHMLRRRTRVL